MELVAEPPVIPNSSSSQSGFAEILESPFAGYQESCLQWLSMFEIDELLLLHLPTSFHACCSHMKCLPLALSPFSSYPKEIGVGL